MYGAMDVAFQQQSSSCLQLALVLCTVLSTISQERAVTEWHISIAWKDESCDSVCRDLGREFRCTEDCWPASASALQRAVEDSPRLGSGTCFDVEAGETSPWHPAKDPENTMCYWDAGSSDEERCLLVANTSWTQASKGYFIRRLCPCYNRTAVEASGWQDLDCAVGPFDVLPPPGSDRFSTSTVPVPGVGAASPSLLTAAAASQQASYLVEETPGGDCQQVCVTGFTSEDARLNGHYVRMNTQYGLLSHWSGGGYWLEREYSGHWRFVEVPADIEVARGTRRSQGLAGIPDSDYFITATGGNQAYFQCCDRTHAFTPAVSQTAGASDHKDADRGAVTNTVVIVLCIALSAAALAGAAWFLLHRYPRLCVVMPCTAACVKWWERRRLRKYITMEPDTPEKPPGKGDEESVVNASPDCLGIGSVDPRSEPTNWNTNYHGPSVETLERQFQEQQRKQKAHQRHITQEAPDPRLHRGNGGGEEQRTGRAGKWRGRALYTCQDRVDDVGTRHGGGGATSSSDAAFGQRTELEAALGVATVLGRSSQTTSARGVYEGPVNNWWDQNASSAAAELRSGTEVRLQGLVSQPTWNGTEGVVDHFDEVKGHVQIRLPDGRIKAVRPENCEVMGGGGGGGGARHLAGHFGGGDFRDAPLPRPSTGSKLPPIVRSETKTTTVSGASKLSKAPPPLPPPPAGFREGFQNGKVGQDIRLEAPTPARAAAGGRDLQFRNANVPAGRQQARGAPAGRQDSRGLTDELDSAQFAVQAQLDTLKARLSDKTTSRPVR